MRSAIKPFFPTLFPGGRQGKLLHREPCLDPEILREVERIVVVDESEVADRSVAGQDQQTQNQGDEQFLAIDGSESIRFHSSVPSDNRLFVPYPNLSRETGSRKKPF